MTYKTSRRIAQVATIFMVSTGVIGVTFYWVVVPFFYAPYQYSSVSDPLRILQFYFIEGDIPWYPLGILFVAFAVFGRGFCGWACPFGFFQDIVHVFTGMDLPEWLHNGLTKVKYLVLVAVFAACYFTATPLFDRINPFATLVASLPRMLLVGFTVDTWVILRLTLFFLLLTSFLFVHRFWCRYLCPVGALAAVFNKVSPLHLHLDPSRCNKCKDCLDVCPTKVNIFDVVRKRPVECILCGDCADVCRRGALSLSFTEKVVREAYTSREEAYGPLRYPLPPDEYIRRKYPPERREKPPLSEVSLRKLRGIRGRIIYFYEDSKEIPPFIKEMETVPTMQVWLVNMKESINLVQHYQLERSTLFINGRVYTGKLEEDAVVTYMFKEYAMLCRLSVVFDTAKCRPCRTRDCTTVCEKIDIRFESKIEAHPLTEFDCFICGECITACKRGGVSLVYGEPKVDFTLNLAHLESLQDKLLEVEPMTLKAFIERDSVHCNKVITMLAAISHLSRGRINFELIDALEEPERTRAYDITFLPTVVVGRFKTFGVPTEGSLVLLIRRSSRWKE
ncbi:MAG: 4Fe-4S binding protein [Theionarchaea archaeon]|nr:4Fe-4S binding protein [Theionarchaea archaeon]